MLRNCSNSRWTWKLIIDMIILNLNTLLLIYELFWYITRPHLKSIQRQTQLEYISASVTVHTMDMNCYIHSMNCTPAVVCSDRVYLSIDFECGLKLIWINMFQK